LITKKKEALGASCGYLYWCQGTKSLAHQRREYPDITQINGPGNFNGWRWLFIVEAILTILIVLLFFFIFPQEPRKAWFLTQEEQAMMDARYANDPHWGIDEEFKWYSCLSIFSDPKWYAL
jgi:MFS family permease